MTVLSGAGISAESGVPTFRDAETGLWAKVDPYEISSAEGWQEHPDKVWAWYLWRHYMMGSVQPNNGHLAVAAAERASRQVRRPGRENLPSPLGC